jgi:CPA2 family monovalent cation:H+ antiporter-2
MIVTPFMVNNIYKLAALFVTEFFESDKITPIEIEQHTVICGFTTVGRIIARELQKKEVNFVIISNNLQHVLLARKRGYHAYFGNLEKLPVLESLKIEHSSNIILTLSSLDNKKVICEAVLEYYPQANLLVKINSIKEKQELADFHIKHFVHGQYETAQLLVNKSIFKHID